MRSKSLLTLNREKRKIVFAVVCDGCADEFIIVATHLELLAFFPRLAQLRGGAAFRRLLLRHQIHVQNCAFTLLEALKKRKEKRS